MTIEEVNDSLDRVAQCNANKDKPGRCGCLVDILELFVFMFSYYRVSIYAVDIHIFLVHKSY